MRSVLVPLLALALVAPAVAARVAPVLPPVALGYADLVDLSLGAPLVAIATVTDVSRLRPEESPGLVAGRVRVYVEAQLNSLIRGSDGVPASVRYLVDLPADTRGRPPRITGARALLFAATVPDRPGELRLIAPDAQIPWSGEAEGTVRAVLKEALGPTDPPRITAVGNAFHVPGSLPGESETQIFLQTADSRPVSLSVLRRLGEPPRWAVALGELVDDSAAPPATGTLLWYRLACSLPPQLPARSSRELAPEDAAAAAADYHVVIAGLGPCGRQRQPG